MQMDTQHVTSVTGRRKFLGATAALPLVTRPGKPDAALIAACKALPARLAAANASESSNGDTPEDLAYYEVEDIILTTPATTMEGLLAKAMAARAYGVENYRGGDPCPDGTYASIAAWRSWHVVNDLLQMGGAA